MLSVSIFTPTNNASYLEELYYSIKNQEYLEWLIFPNNGLSMEDIPEVILEDGRTVMVTTDDPPTSNIGALKKICCSVASGTVLAEVDHDDILTPTAIDKIQQAFEDPEVVFAYSDSAAFNDDVHRTPRFYGSANIDNMYDATYGWKYYDYEQDGFSYKAAVTPDPIPAHVSIIHHCADHVRAFRRSAYEEIGGYDASLSVCDDQDLVCRLYLKGRFKHIKECLYLYRVSGNQNTWLQRNDLIQKTTIELQKKYIRPLVESWCIKNNLPMIDLCGGINPKEGYVSIDLTGADITADLNERWPLETSSIGIIRASDAIEHLKSIVFTMSEIHRVLVPGGYLIADTPSSDGRGSFMDPTHITHINQNSFWYYTRQDQARFIRNTEIRFQEIVLETYFPNEWARVNNIPYVRSDLIALKTGGPKIMGQKFI